MENNLNLIFSEINKNKILNITIILKKSSKIFDILKSHLNIYLNSYQDANDKIIYKYSVDPNNEKTLSDLRKFKMLKDFSDKIDLFKNNVIFNSIDEIEDCINKRDIDYLSVYYNENSKLAIIYCEGIHYLLIKNNDPFKLQIDCLGSEYEEVLPKFKKFTSIDEVIDYVEDEQKRKNYKTKYNDLVGGKYEI